MADGKEMTKAERKAAAFAQLDAIKERSPIGAAKRAEVEDRLDSLKKKLINEQTKTLDANVVETTVQDTVAKVRAAAQKYVGGSDAFMSALNAAPNETNANAKPVSIDIDKLLQVEESENEVKTPEIKLPEGDVTVNTELLKMFIVEIQTLKEMVVHISSTIELMNKAQQIKDAVTPKKLSVQEFGIMKPNGRVDHTEDITTDEAIEMLAEGNVRDVYGNISIAVVTGDMITNSERIDDANSDGGAKYFDDLYMSMLKKQDSKDYLLEILKSRVDRDANSPVERLAREVKQQHDVEKIMLLKMQLDKLQQEVLERAKSRE